MPRHEYNKELKEAFLHNIKLYTQLFESTLNSSIVSYRVCHLLNKPDKQTPQIYIHS